jgi:hypothetical protein
VLLKNAHLRRSPHPSLLRRTFKYAALLRISGALHLGIFDQPEKNFFSKLLVGLPLAELLGHLNNFRYLLIYTQLLQPVRKIYYVYPNHMILISTPLTLSDRRPRDGFVGKKKKAKVGS